MRGRSGNVGRRARPGTKDQPCRAPGAEAVVEAHGGTTVWTVEIRKEWRKEGGMEGMEGIPEDGQWNEHFAAQVRGGIVHVLPRGLQAEVAALQSPGKQWRSPARPATWWGAGRRRRFSARDATPIRTLGPDEERRLPAPFLAARERRVELAPGRRSEDEHRCRAASPSSSMGAGGRPMLMSMSICTVASARRGGLCRGGGHCHRVVSGRASILSRYVRRHLVGGARGGLR